MTDLPVVDDVVDLLSAGHLDLLDLLDRTSGAPPGPDRTALLGRAADALRRHVVVEERYLHPVLRRVLDDGDRRVESDVEQHEQLERLLLELEVAGPDAPATDALLRGLACAARRHVDVVERWRLPALSRHLTADERAGLARDAGPALHVPAARRAQPT